MVYFYVCRILRRPRSTLFPYTTLFRSVRLLGEVGRDGVLQRMGDAERVELVHLAELAGELGGRKVDRKSTRLNSSHRTISYAVFCLKKKNQKEGSGAEAHQLATDEAKS